MDRKPDRALAALRSSRTDGLSNELRDQRLLLEARALSEIGRRDLALDMIENIPGHETMRLRADILWAAKRWRQAAEQIELLYGDRWRQFTPLNEAERIDVLRAAIGYALANESIGLQRFRDKYMAKMSDSPDAHAFEVVTAPTGTGGAEFKDVAQTVALRRRKRNSSSPPHGLWRKTFLTPDTEDTSLGAGPGPATGSRRPRTRFSPPARDVRRPK